MREDSQVPLKILMVEKWVYTYSEIGVLLEKFYVLMDTRERNKQQAKEHHTPCVLAMKDAST